MGAGDGESFPIRRALADNLAEVLTIFTAAHKFEGFLAVASRKGDTLSLFETKG